jgi:hypothetical protein
MFSKIADGDAPILVVMTLLVAPSRGYADDTPRSPSRPWPIWNWQNHQPRQDHLKAAHTDDLTAQDARKVDQLYWQLEGRIADRDGQLRCKDHLAAGARKVPGRKQCEDSAVSPSADHHGAATLTLRSARCAAARIEHYSGPQIKSPSCPIRLTRSGCYNE